MQLQSLTIKKRTESHLHVLRRTAAQLVSRLWIIAHLTQPLPRWVAWWGGLVTVWTSDMVVSNFGRRRVWPYPWQRGVLVVVVVVKQDQLGYNLAVMRTPQVVVSVLDYSWRSDPVRGRRRRGGRRRTSKTCHFRLRPVEVFIGRPTNVQNGGLRP